MREKRTGKRSAKAITDWMQLQSLGDREIRRAIAADAKARPTAEFWRDARVVMPKRKEAITIRLDADLLTWFRRRQS